RGRAGAARGDRVGAPTHDALAPAVAIGRDTARLKQQFGTTHECLPGPPATTTSTSSGDGTCGGRASSSRSAVIHGGQSCIPHIPPSLSVRSGSRACSYTKRCTSARERPSAAIVRACSGPRTTRSWLWEKYQPTFEPSVAAVSLTVERMPLAVVEA